MRLPARAREVRRGATEAVGAGKGIRGQDLSRVFYGWKIVGATFLTHFVAVGFIFYSYGAFFKGLANDFESSRLEVSLGLSLMNLVTGVFAPFLGRALDRGHVRVIMLAGALCMATGFFLASQITELWQFYVVLGTFLGLGAAMLGGLPGSTLVANWFVERRGAALGLSATGISFSGMIMAPFATDLIDTYGWRETFIFYGVGVLVLVLPVVWIWIVNRPEDMGLEPDGKVGGGGTSIEPQEPVLPLAPGDQMTDHAPHLEWSTLGMLRSVTFWLIVLVVAFNFSAMSAVLVHIIPHATDIGYTPGQAARVLAAMAGAGIVGKVFFGSLSDRADKRLTLGLATGLQILGVALLLETQGYAWLLAAGLVFGLGMGGLVPLWGALVGAVFGRFAFGRVMGLMSPCMQPIHVAGVPFAGWVFDVRGSYDLAFQVLIGVYGLTFLLLFFLRLPKGNPRT